MFHWNEMLTWWLPGCINKFLCSLACTWMAIIDSQYHIIDSQSYDVPLE